jgi:flavin-dependent dehydrogenase
MQSNEPFYDIAVIGGGLAGLALAIQGAQKGFSVALFEKEEYPFHKVCGEYISLESWEFITSLGLDLSSMQLPIIKKLIVTSPNGNVLNQNLPLGGFGISRYLLDNELKKIAHSLGVHIYENSKVDGVVFLHESVMLYVGNQKFSSKVCCGAFGKKSNIDVKWHRDFIDDRPNKLDNFIGVKYHITTTFDVDTIALHNFEGGYCGISKIERDKYCLCYLTTAKNLKDNGNSIEKLEKNILHQNPHLKKIFTESEFLFNKPLVISQISFSKKTQVENNVLLLGDAAGMITPLCGNGMSMALHSSKIAMNLIHQFLTTKISRIEMETQYQSEWNTLFAKRLKTGRFVQKLFGKIWLTNFFISCMKTFSFLPNWLIKKTHGKPF